MRLSLACKLTFSPPNHASPLSQELRSNMKGITNVVLAAACLASASAHTMLICSATSCETPGRVTLFLGTYHTEPRNANSPATPGSITVTTMGGDDFEFAFSATCGAEDGLSGTSSFEDVKRSMLSTTSQNSCRSQGSTSAHAGGKNIIDDNSQVRSLQGSPSLIVHARSSLLSKLSLSLSLAHPLLTSLLLSLCRSRAIVLMAPQL